MDYYRYTRGGGSIHTYMALTAIRLSAITLDDVTVCMALLTKSRNPPTHCYLLLGVGGSDAKKQEVRSRAVIC